MSRHAWGAMLPSVITVCLPFLGHAARAADRVEVPDGAGTWAVTIAPRAEAPAEPAIRLAAFEDEVDGPAVPAPLEPAAAVAAEAAPIEAAVSGPACCPGPADASAYWAVYRSIPFMRSEYLANPSYRHEATMEILFGQLRPTVVHKHQGPAIENLPPALPAFAPPWVYDRHLSQIPTFLHRYAPPAIPLPL